MTLVELLVVLCIVAIMLAGIGSVLRSGKTASGRASAVAAARSMGDAIDDFRKDHAGRPPVLGTTPSAPDWPTPTKRGPRNSYSGSFYLKPGSGDPIDGKLAALSSTATSSARFTLHYTTSAKGWRIVVRDRDGVTKPCTLFGGTPPPVAGTVRTC